MGSGWLYLPLELERDPSENRFSGIPLPARSESNQRRARAAPAATLSAPPAFGGHTEMTLVRWSPSRQASAAIVVVGLHSPEVQNTEEPPT
jgi:hypothetical protein